MLVRHGCELHHQIAPGGPTIIEICQNLKLCQKACDLKLLGHADDAHVQLYRMRVGRKVEDKGKTLDEARAMMKEPGEAAKDALRKREGPRNKFFEV